MCPGEPRVPTKPKRCHLPPHKRVQTVRRLSSKKSTCHKPTLIHNSSRLSSVHSHPTLHPRRTPRRLSRTLTNLSVLVSSLSGSSRTPSSQSPSRPITLTSSASRAVPRPEPPTSSERCCGPPLHYLSSVSSDVCTSCSRVERSPSAREDNQSELETDWSRTNRVMSYYYKKDVLLFLYANDTCRINAARDWIGSIGWSWGSFGVLSGWIGVVSSYQYYHAAE